MTKEPKPTNSLRRSLRRGFGMHCPRCGVGEIYCGWAPHHVNDECSCCGLRFARREGDLWFFYYMSSAFITGLFLVLAVILFWQDVMTYPGEPGTWAVLCTALVLSLVLSLRRRKALAIAVDYVVDERLGGESSAVNAPRSPADRSPP